MTWRIRDDILDPMNRLPRDPAWLFLAFLLSFVPAVVLYYTFDRAMAAIFQPKADIISWLMFFIVGSAALLSSVVASVSAPVLTLYFIGEVRLEDARERLGVSAQDSKRKDPAVFLAVGLAIAGIAFRFFSGESQTVGMTIGGLLVLYGTVRSLLNIFVPESQL